MKTNPQFPTKTASGKASKAKRVAIYARVSTQEQTKGQYPSCDSQIEELEQFCSAKGWLVFEAIKDQGHRAGTLKRPGLTRLRWLVESGQIDGVACTWYNRLIGSRDFYILDREFKAHNVSFSTIHDPTDRNTAAGRLLESVLVTIKTFENEQVAEKVRTKLRQRAEKGLFNGGPIPFGHAYDPATQKPGRDEAASKIVAQMFQVYVESASDVVVRNWLRSREIPSPGGEAVWPVSTIHGLLTNRCYIGEIEINKHNRNLEDVPEHEACRIVRSPYEPLVTRELFELAQTVRREKASGSPNRVGKPRSHSQNQCNRVFPLQGQFYCGVCGHAMTPYYVVHKAGREKSGKLRKQDSYIFYYICARQMMKGRHACGHSNRVSAKLSESWILDRINELITTEGVLEAAFETARVKCQSDLQPLQHALNLTRLALQENQAKIDALIDTISGGSVSGDLLGMLDEKATQLKRERERLRSEQRNLALAVAPLSDYFETLPIRQTLRNFAGLARAAEPSEMQRLLRTTVRRLEWMPDGSHAVEFYGLANRKAGLQNQEPRPGMEPHLGLGLESEQLYASP